MGLLDDAIKQHLELKRKHGATDDEVKRQEAEALGPARRDFAAAPEPAAETVDGKVVAEEEPVARQPTSWLDEDEPTAVEPPVDEVLPPKPAPPAQPDQVPPPTPPAPDPVPPGPPAPPQRDPAPPEPPPVPPEPGPPPAPTTSDTPTQGFDALSREDLEEEKDDEEDEDVLEETPDFLQDTPEHDRLWFEQKPPRDFDFDG